MKRSLRFQVATVGEVAKSDQVATVSENAKFGRVAAVNKAAKSSQVATAIPVKRGPRGRGSACRPPPRRPRTAPSGPVGSG